MNSEIIAFLLAPYVACLILVANLSYFGLHVVARGIIFVDLALAQIAALGTTVALLRGSEPGDPEIYLWSLGFTLAGSALFAVTRPKREDLPQEAIIGVVYAVAAAFGILLADHIPGGTEHLKHVLVGSLLATSWTDVIRTLVLCGAVGLFHWFFRRRFLLVSVNPESAEKEGVSVRLWDFLFYFSFGLMIPTAVSIAGVLLVFTFLIVPALVASLFLKSFGQRLLLGWIVGAVTVAMGLGLSLGFDLPTGAVVVCTFGGVLALGAIGMSFWREDRPGSFVKEKHS